MPHRKERRVMKGFKVTVTLPTYLIDNVDSLAEETKIFRSDVVAAILDYVFDHEEVLDEIFPYEDDGGAESQ